MRDPYEVLGVKKTADAAAIKSAYRRLAKKLHPDANKNDPKTAQRFAEINSAYEILGEEKKRKAFDAGEIDAEGKPRFQGFGARPGAGAGAGGPDAHFETFSFGPEGVPGARRCRRGQFRGRHQPDVRRSRQRAAGAPDPSAAASSRRISVSPPAATSPYP